MISANLWQEKIKEIIDTKSSFADWLNNQIVRDQLKFDIKVCLMFLGHRSKIFIPVMLLFFYRTGETQPKKVQFGYDNNRNSRPRYFLI